MLKLSQILAYEEIVANFYLFLLQFIGSPCIHNCAIFSISHERRCTSSNWQSSFWRYRVHLYHLFIFALWYYARNLIPFHLSAIFCNVRKPKIASNISYSNTLPSTGRRGKGTILSFSSNIPNIEFQDGERLQEATKLENVLNISEVDRCISASLKVQSLLSAGFALETSLSLSKAVWRNKSSLKTVTAVLCNGGKNTKSLFSKFLDSITAQTWRKPSLENSEFCKCIDCILTLHVCAAFQK